MKYAILALLLLSSFAFPLQTPLEKFMNDTFEPDEDLKIENLSYFSGNYVLIRVGGEERYVVDSYSGKAVYDEKQLESILIHDLKNASGFDAKVNSSVLLATEVNTAKRSVEAQCMLLTGTDMHDCFDRDSCILACKSNPNCDILLYSDGFWEAILAWTDHRKKFESAILEFDLGIGDITKNAENIDKKLVVLENLLTHAKYFGESPIFLNRTDEGCSGNNVTRRCYEYCKKVDYSLGRFETEKLNLVELKELVFELSLQDERAATIVNRSRKNDAYISTRGREYEIFRLSMENEIARLKSADAELQKKINDSSIAEKISDLENLSDSVNALAEAELYRKALSKKSDFDTLSRETKYRINDELEEYESFQRKMGTFDERIRNATWILGNSSAERYFSEAGRINDSIGSPATMDSVKNATVEMEILEKKLASELLENAANPDSFGKRQAQGQQLPCLPAFAVMFIAAFAAKVGTKR